MICVLGIDSSRGTQALEVADFGSSVMGCQCCNERILSSAAELLVQPSFSLCWWAACLPIPSVLEST